MEHTQGKWEVTGQSENSRYITVKSDNGRTVARVPWNSEKEVEQDICTDNNDAILIANAPEMLQALKDSLMVLHEYQIEESRQNELWDIIAKAEGKESKRITLSGNFDYSQYDDEEYSHTDES